MLKSFLLKKFPNDKIPEEIIKAKKNYIFTKENKYLDFTSGWTTFATMGYQDNEILNAMKQQMKKFNHIDYNVWYNSQTEILAKKIVKLGQKNLEKVYLGGSSGSDAIEAAMKLSYHVHYDSGNKNKKYFISRIQSYNGSTLQAISTSDLPILKLYDELLPTNIKKISQHNPYAECAYDVSKQKCICGKNKKTPCMGKFKNETNNDYEDRCVRELENAILKIGPHKVCAFVGETQLGSLVGDVPPSKNYWKKIRKVCNKYNVHIILDEVYCGVGRSGKFFNFSHDNFTPDFVCIGKNFTGGHAPLSAVITKKKFEDIIAKGSGRIQLGHTFQGYALGVAAAIKMIEIFNEKKILNRVYTKGKYMRNVLFSELKNNPFFKNIRGRGYLFSLEHQCSNNHLFALNLSENIKQNDKIIINSKWHRTSFAPSYITTDKQIDFVLERFIYNFKKVSLNWNTIKNKSNFKVSKSMGGIKKNN